MVRRDKSLYMATEIIYIIRTASIMGNSWADQMRVFPRNQCGSLDSVPIAAISRKRIRHDNLASSFGL